MLSPEELTERNETLRKLRETSVEQRQKQFQEQWKNIIAVLKKTKTEFAQATLDNLNNGIPPQGKALKLCEELLAKSLKPTPTPRKKKTTNATTTKNNRTRNQKTGQSKK